MALRSAAWGGGSTEELNYPDIFLIGAMKAGTTSLYNLITNNTALNATLVVQPICNFGEKEKHFFVGPEIAKDFKKSLTHYIQEFSGCAASQQTIDATPGYSGRRQAEVIAHMKETYTADQLSKKKFIYVLREPVARLYSEYQMSVRLCLDLDDDLTRFGGEEDAATKTWRIDRHETACQRLLSAKNYRRFRTEMLKVDYEDILSFHEWCLTDYGLEETLRGNYRLIIWRFLNNFLARQQLFVLNFDMLIFNTAFVMQALERFLGTPSWGSNVTLPAPPRSSNHPKTTLDCTTVEMLEKYYNVSNAHIYQYIASTSGQKPESEPAFSSFASATPKCVRLAPNDSFASYPIDTWKFSALVQKVQQRQEVKDEKEGFLSSSNRFLRSPKLS